MKHVHVGYNARVPKVVKGIVNNKATGAAGVEDGMVGVFNTRTIKVGGRESLCMKGGTIDGFVFALCSLVDYSVID